jgi:hypothetical protein
MSTTGQTASRFMEIPAHTLRTIDVAGQIEGFGDTEFAVGIESDVPIAVDGSESWDAAGYGSSSERGVTGGPGREWYLAEGATHSGFNLFYSFQNPGDTAAELEVTFLRPGGQPPIVWTDRIGPYTRRSLHVNSIPGLEAAEVSGVVRSVNGVPVLVSRGMYLGSQGRGLEAGHESAAIRAPAVRWLLPEGATGPFFDEFVLIANPSTQVAQVDVTYLRPVGPPLVKRHVVPPLSRYGIWVDYDLPELADSAVSSIVESVNGVGVVVERAMWWPGSSWHEAHSSAGETEVGTRWAFAGGEAGGTRNAETYVLVANSSARAGTARITILFEDGNTLAQEIALGPMSRTNVAVAVAFPEALGRRFGVLVESLGDFAVPVVVERAVYSDADGVSWAAGADALATRLP